jgi:Holliday junction resolvase RusA-like endonuclease
VTTVFQITVPGDPVGKARPRVTMRGTFMPKKYKAYIKKVSTVTQYAMRGRQAIDRPIKLTVDTYKSRPKSRPSTCSKELWVPERVPCPTKPDADNALGSIMDGLEQGGAYTMDSRVHCALIRTWWCALGESPRVDVLMEVY